MLTSVMILFQHIMKEVLNNKLANSVMPTLIGIAIDKGYI